MIKIIEVTDNKFTTKQQTMKMMMMMMMMTATSTTKQKRMEDYRQGVMKLESEAKNPWPLER